MPSTTLKAFAEAVCLVTVRTTENLAERRREFSMMPAPRTSTRNPGVAFQWMDPEVHGHYKPNEGDRKMEVVEEDLDIGKGEVGGRRVALYSEVTSKPVRKTGQPARRKDHVDRRGVDRAGRSWRLGSV